MKLNGFISTLILFAFSMSSMSQSWSWKSQSVGAQYQLKCIQFVSEETGYAGGIDKTDSSGVLFRTSDSGATWTKVNTYNREIHSLFFTSELKGHLGADSGFCFSTVDGGLTLKNSFTTDIRQEWYPDILCMEFLNDTLGLMSSSEGLVYITTDGGDNWNWAKATYMPLSISDLQILSDSIYMICGFDDGQFARKRGRSGYSLNAALTWRYQTPYDTFWSYGMHYQKSGYGVLVGKGGEIFRTFNRGLNLFASSSPVSTDLFDTEFLSVEQGWAVGDSGQILISSDSGITWSIDTTIGDYQIVHLESDGNTVHACGDGGMIYKRTKLKPSSISQTHTAGIEMLVFPNPSTGMLNLSSKHQIEQIQLIDLHGKLCWSKNNGSSPMDLSGLDKGIYILQVRTSAGIENKKIILQ